MKFTIKQINLSKILAITGKAINPRITLPMLSNFLVKTEKGRVKITASDLHMTISGWIGAKIDEQGEFAVPARLLTDFATQVKDETIDFELSGATLKASTAKAKANFAGSPASEFPAIEVDHSGQKIVLKSKDFVDALSKVVFAVAADDSRPILTGIYFRAENNVLTLAGTDGFRMAEHKLTLSEALEKPVKCVIPGRNLFDVVKSFSAFSEELTFTLNTERNVVVITAEDLEAQIRLLEGDFPDYEAVLPDEFSSETKILSSELGNAIKLASIFSKEHGNMIKFVASDEVIQVISQPTESGSNTVNITGEFSGEGIEIAFNAKYILDFVANIPEVELSFNTIESLKPGMFKIVDNADYFYLVMPMRANW